jgi:hypothetical protein
MSYSGTVHCGHCYNQGHNVRGCPTLKKEALADPESYNATKYARIQESKKRVKICSYCGTGGHNRRGCKKSTEHKAIFRADLKLWRQAIQKWTDDTGLKIGALVRAHVSYYEKDGTYMDPQYEKDYVPAVCLVTNIQLNWISHYASIATANEWRQQPYDQPAMLMTTRVGSADQANHQGMIGLGLPCITGIVPQFGVDYYDREVDRKNSFRNIDWEVVSPGHKSIDPEWISDKSLSDGVKKAFAGGIDAKNNSDFRELTPEQRIQLQMYVDGTFLLNELIDTSNTKEK